MIYTLKYVSHPIERVNQVVYKFLENSIPDGTYNHELFPEWFRDVVASSPVFNSEFLSAFNELQNLDIPTRQRLFDEFRDGIDIFCLCNNPHQSVVLTESYSPSLHTALNILLKDRFYGASLSRNQILQNKLAITLRDHYIEFKNLNNKGRVCPFCGLHEYSILDGESKDDYDHWLYKAKYPLYAVNFSNLVPMCGKCNQTGVKGTADVLHYTNTNLRRKFFYPYVENAGVAIKVIAFHSTDFLTEEIKKKYPLGYFNVCVRSNTPEEQNQVDGWKNVFNIETRFNSYLSDNYHQLTEELFEDYLPEHPEFIISRDRANLIEIVERFKNQLGKPTRRAGVNLDKAYLDFICLPENAHLLFTFFRINLAA